MTIDFTCQKCESSFELDAQDLIDGTEKLVCPHCDAKAPANLVEDFVAALTEMRAQVAAIGKKFGVTMAFEADEIVDEVDEDEDEDEDDDDEASEDDDELDFEDEEGDEDEDDDDDDDEDLEEEDDDR